MISQQYEVQTGFQNFFFEQACPRAAGKLGFQLLPNKHAFLFKLTLLALSLKSLPQSCRFLGFFTPLRFSYQF